MRSGQARPSQARSDHSKQASKHSKQATQSITATHQSHRAGKPRMQSQHASRRIKHASTHYAGWAGLGEGRQDRENGEHFVFKSVAMCLRVRTLLMYVRPGITSQLSVFGCGNYRFGRCRSGTNHHCRRHSDVAMIREPRKTLLSSCPAPPCFDQPRDTVVRDRASAGPTTMMGG